MQNEDAIIQAFRRSDFQTAKQLLDNGEPLPKTIEKFALSDAIRQIVNARHFEYLDLLIDKGLIELDIYEYDRFDGTIIDQLFTSLKDEGADLEWFKGFLSKLTSKNDEVNNQTLLGYAFEKGAHPKVIEALIEAGCDTSYKNNAEENFIMRVVNTYTPDTEKSLAYVDLLIAEGLDVNAPNIVKKTPLMAAVQGNKKHFLDVLLNNGAEPNHADNEGKTAFLMPWSISRVMRFMISLHRMKYPILTFAIKMGKLC